MVFVYPPRRRSLVVPTSDEERAVARLRARGLAGEELAAALAGEGTDPERARQLASQQTYRASGSFSVGAVPVVLIAVLAIASGVGRRPLTDWLHRELPGYEWLARLAFPLLLLLFVLVKLAASRLRSEDVPQGPTRADRIDNRPIG